MKKLLIGFTLLISLHAFSQEECKNIETVKIMSLYGSDSLLEAGRSLDAQLNGRFQVSHHTLGSIFIYPVRQYLFDDNQKITILLESKGNICKSELEQLKNELNNLDFTTKELDSLTEKTVNQVYNTWIGENDVRILLGQKPSI